MHNSRTVFVGVAVALATAWGSSISTAETPQAEASPASTPSAFKVLVEADGVYRVDFQSLAAEGLEPAPSDRLALEVAGDSVPLWVEDGGDGVFGPGDHVEFVGQRLRGERSWVHDFAWLNVYRLTLDGDGARMRPGSDGAASIATVTPRVRRHLEEDALLVRLPGAKVETDDPWFWHKLVHNRPEPTPIPLDLS
ncbi:MAG: hypothetical protein AAFY88_25320, partial [Acidobacteriota bacterium]